MKPVAVGLLPLSSYTRFSSWTTALLLRYILDPPEPGLAKPIVADFATNPHNAPLVLQRAHRSFSELTGGSEIGVVCFRVMEHIHTQRERGREGGDVFSRLVVRLGCLWIIMAFLFVASIGIASDRACIASASVPCTPGESIRRPHIDAAQTSELRLCEKHFWRDIGRSYFGARANRVWAYVS